MPNAQKLIQSFQTTTWLINKQADGLSHEQMLLQLPFRGNCFNWILGHTVGDRINGLHWHETYHTGQLEILRQLAGTNDRIVG